MKWFRFYSEVLNDPKVQNLTPVNFKQWINLLCLANEQEPRGTIADDIGAISFALRLKSPTAIQAMSFFESMGFLERDDASERWYIHGWAKRQYNSDDTTQRTRKFRSNERPGNVPETPPDTEAETEQNRDRKQRQSRANPLDDVVADFAAFGATNAGTVRAIEEAVDDYSLEWVKRAVSEARGSGAEGAVPWNYCIRTLERWKTQGGPDEPRIQSPRNGHAGTLAASKALESSPFANIGT